MMGDSRKSSTQKTRNLQLAHQLNKILRKFERSMDSYYFEVCAMPQESGNEERLRLKLNPEAKQLLRKKVNTYDERIDKIFQLKPHYFDLYTKTKITIVQFQEKYKGKNYKIIVYKGKAHRKFEVPDFNIHIIAEAEKFSSELKQKFLSGTYKIKILIKDSTVASITKEEETSTENSEADQNDKRATEGEQSG